MLNENQHILNNIELLNATLLKNFNNSIFELTNESNVTNNLENSKNRLNILNSNNLINVTLKNVTNNLNESEKNQNQIYLITDDQLKLNETKTNPKNVQTALFKEIEHRKHKTKHKNLKKKLNLASKSLELIPSKKLTPGIAFKQNNKKKHNYKTHKHQYFKRKFNKEISDLNIKTKKNYLNEHIKYGESIFDARYNFPESKYSYNNKNDINYVNKNKNEKNYMIIDDRTSLISKKIKPKVIYNNNDENENYDPNNNLDLLLKYLKKPKLPKGTILWREKNAPIPLVYFAVTIIKGSLSRRGKPPLLNKRRVHSIKIFLIGLNMPTGYTQITEVIIFSYI